MSINFNKISQFSLSGALSLLLIFPLTTQGQTAPQKDKKAQLGTFYLKEGSCSSCGKDNKIYLSPATLKTIADKRRQSETVYFYLEKQQGGIVIPSKETIQQPDFQPYDSSVFTTTRQR